MPRGATANWTRHQYKKAATQVYAIAVSAGSRGNVGKLCPQDTANPIKGPALKTVFSGFQTFAVGRTIGMPRISFEQGGFS